MHKIDKKIEEFKKNESNVHMIRDLSGNSLEEEPIYLEPIRKKINLDEIESLFEEEKKIRENRSVSNFHSTNEYNDIRLNQIRNSSSERKIVKPKVESKVVKKEMNLKETEPETPVVKTNPLYITIAVGFTLFLMIYNEITSYY